MPSIISSLWRRPVVTWPTNIKNIRAAIRLTIISFRHLHPRIIVLTQMDCDTLSEQEVPISMGICNDGRTFDNEVYGDTNFQFAAASWKGIPQIFKSALGSLDIVTAIILARHDLFTTHSPGVLNRRRV